MEKVLAPILRHVDQCAPGSTIGVHLFGSAAATGLRPDSDIDLLILTRQSLTVAERLAMVSTLLDVSGWKGHMHQFPQVAGRRPVEVTSLVLGDLRPLTGAPRRDFQYGEWLREDLLNGLLLQPVRDPDVVVLLAAAQTSHQVLRGPALSDLVDPVAPELLRQAVLAVVPGLVREVAGDERNVLLSLARVLVTLETGRVVSKDAAARAVGPRLASSDRTLLDLARAGYLGQVRDDWSEHSSHAVTLARNLAALAQRISLERG